jgi:hypothetical protein
MLPKVRLLLLLATARLQLLLHPPPTPPRSPAYVQHVSGSLLAFDDGRGEA